MELDSEVWGSIVPKEREYGPLQFLILRAINLKARLVEVRYCVRKQLDD
jgi:hypothetical protein